MVDRSAVGRSLAQVTARVEPGRLRFFLDTIRETNGLLRRDGAALPPTYLFCLEMLDAADPFGWLAELDIDLARILHGEQAFTYLAPVSAGDVLTFSPCLVDVTDKKGGAMTLVVIDTAVTNQRGAHVADLSRTIVVRNGVAA